MSRSFTIGNHLEYAGADEIIEHTGITGLLANEVYRRYASSARGQGGEIVPAAGIECLAKWAQAVGLVEPTLEWEVQERGRDMLVRPVVRGGPHYLCGADLGLSRAARVLTDAVERVWRSYRRYHRQPGGQRRLKNDQREVVRIWETLLPIWSELACDAIGRALTERVWRVKYHWAMPPANDGRMVVGDVIGQDTIVPMGVPRHMPHVAGEPMSPPAWRAQRDILAAAAAEAS